MLRALFACVHRVVTFVGSGSCRRSQRHLRRRRRFFDVQDLTMRDATITSARPELEFPAVAKSLGESMRAALVASGLKDLPDKGDLIAESSVRGVDYEIGPFGRANVVRP